MQANIPSKRTVPASNPKPSQPPTTPVAEPKKGSKALIIIIVLIVVIFVLAGAAGAAYILLKNSKDKDTDTGKEDNGVQEEEQKEVTPEEAYTQAMAKFTSESYYEYTSEMDLPLEASVPAFPQLDMNFNITGTEDGKLNLEDGDSYYLTKSAIDFDNFTSEVYYVDGRVYARDNLTSAFTEYTEDEAAELYNSESTVLNIITDLSDDVDYTVLENEDLEGSSNYVYLITITKEDLADLIDGLNQSLQESGIEISESQAVVTGATVKVWIDKEDVTVTKGVMAVQTLSLTGSFEGYSVMFSIDNMSANISFDKWGEAEEIVLPTS